MADISAITEVVPQTVNVVNPYGQPENIPQESLNDALGVGYKVASPQAVQDYKDAQTYGSGVANPVEAFAAGAARTSTFGLSDQLLTKTGAVKPETLAGLKKYNPISSTAGDIAGIGGSILAAPELSPVGAVAKMGQGVTEALAPALSESAPLVGKILGQAGAGAAGSAVEGAAYGLGQSVTEQALGDPDLNAQKLLSNVGYGALWGGAIGGLLKGGEAAAPAVVDAAKDSLGKIGTAIYGAAGDDVGPLGQVYAHASSFVSGRPYEEIVQALKDRELSLTTPHETHDLAADLSKALSDHVDNLNTITKDANNVMRPDETNRILESVPNAAPLEKFSSTIEEMKQAASEMKADPILHDQYYAKIMDDLAGTFSSKITTDSSSADIFNTMNDLKKQLDGEIPYGKGTMLPPNQKRALSLLRNVRGGIKDSLEDESVFGEAGSRQAAWNDAQNQHLTLTGNKGQFKKYFLEPTVTRSGQQVMRVSPTKVKSFLSQLGNLTGDSKAQVLQEFLDSSDNLIQQAQKTYETLGTEPIGKMATSDMVAQTKGLRDKAVEQTEFNKRLNMLGAGAHNTYLGEAGALFAGVHHPVLGAGIEAFNMLRNPGLTVQRLAKIEKSVATATKAIGAGAKAVFKATGASADVLGGYTAGRLSSDLDTDKHQKIVGQINDLANNPQKMVDALDHATRELYHVAPQISQNLQSTAVRATQFLASKIPKDNDQTRGPLSPPYMPSQSEIAEFQKNLALVKDPISVFNQIKNATITQDSIEAVQTVYPKLYQEMQTHLMDELTNMVAKKKAQDIPYRVKLAASLFLGQDLDGTMSPQSIASNQMAQSQMGQQQAKNEVAGQIKSSQAGLSKIGRAQAMMTSQQQSAQRESES